MMLRLVTALLLAVVLASTAPLRAQTPAPDAPPQNAPSPDAAPGTNAPEPPADGDMVPPPVVDPKGVETRSVPNYADPLTRPDGFGDAMEMVPVPVLQKKATSSWDDAFPTIVDTLKQVDAELARLKLKPVGAPFVIYTLTDDAGFEFEASVPFEGATTEKPKDGMEFSASPGGKALRFTHRGPYDAMDPTYEQIANLLDAKDLEAQDLYIEEYRSDPRTTPQDDLVIDIWVPLK